MSYRQKNKKLSAQTFVAKRTSMKRKEFFVEFSSCTVNLILKELKLKRKPVNELIMLMRSPELFQVSFGSTHCRQSHCEAQNMSRKWTGHKLNITEEFPKEVPIMQVL